MTILLIDDNEILPLFLSQTFKDANVECKLVTKRLVKDGLEYLKKNSEEFPDFIFLDINLPVKNGFDFLEEYERLNYHKTKSTKIVILTTSIFFTDKEKAKSYPMVVEFVTKPIDVPAINSIMEKHFSI